MEMSDVSREGAGSVATVTNNSRRLPAAGQTGRRPGRQAGVGGARSGPGAAQAHSESPHGDPLRPAQPGGTTPTSAKLTLRGSRAPRPARAPLFYRCARCVRAPVIRLATRSSIAFVSYSAQFKLNAKKKEKQGKSRAERLRARTAFPPKYALPFIAAQTNAFPKWRHAARESPAGRGEPGRARGRPPRCEPRCGLRGAGNQLPP